MSEASVSSSADDIRRLTLLLTLGETKVFFLAFLGDPLFAAKTLLADFAVFLLARLGRELVVLLDFFALVLVRVFERVLAARAFFPDAAFFSLMELRCPRSPGQTHGFALVRELYGADSPRAIGNLLKHRLPA